MSTVLVYTPGSAQLTIPAARVKCGWPAWFGVHRKSQGGVEGGGLLGLHGIGVKSSLPPHGERVW
jgi:hypothetical protein